MGYDDYKLATPEDSKGCRCDECNEYFDCFEMRYVTLNFKELNLCPECFIKITN